MLLQHGRGSQTEGRKSKSDTHRFWRDCPASRKTCPFHGSRPVHTHNSSFAYSSSSGTVTCPFHVPCPVHTHTHLIHLQFIFSHNCCYIGYVHFMDHVLSCPHTHTIISFSYFIFKHDFCLLLQFNMEPKEKEDWVSFSSKPLIHSKTQPSDTQ